MVESTIKGTLYLKKGDESFYSNKGVQDIFVGVFGLAHDIPYYFMNIDHPEIVPNPHDIYSNSKSYQGIIHVISSPGIALASASKMYFKYGKYNQFLKTKDLIIPTNNVGYIEYAVNGTNYVAIPTGNVAAIQYQFVM